MSKDKLKVNITFSLEVPIQTDRVGRRLSLTNQVAGYINDYMSDVRINQMWTGRNWGVSDGASELDMEIYEKMTSEECVKSVKKYSEDLALSCKEQEKKAEENRIKHDKFKDKECIRLYGCSWLNFKTLTWDEQQEMRREHNVVWKDGQWVKSRKEG